MNKPADMKAIATVPLWINGKAQAASSQRMGDVTDPATGAVTKKVPFCNDADIAAAVAAGRAASYSRPASCGFKPPARIATARARSSSSPVLIAGAADRN